MAATLLISQTLTGLRREVETEFTEGSVLAGILGFIRDTAVSAKPDVEGIGDISITYEIGVDGELNAVLPGVDGEGASLETPDDQVGFLELRIRVPIPEALAYNPRGVDNPLHDFMEAVFSGVSGYVGSLGEEAMNAFVAMTGINGDGSGIKMRITTSRTDG